MRSKQSGFTLVEIAIVLVIIGLLLGGVLKGQELINSAKIKHVANDLNGIAAGVYAYQDRYKTFPGDDGGAQARWASTFNGNKNGVVGADPTGVAAASTANYNDAPPTALAATTNETILFWHHMRIAGFVAGATTAADGGNQPQNAVGGIVGIQTGAGLVPEMGGLVVCTSNLNGKIAGAIDQQFDDGVGNTGTLRAFDQVKAPVTRGGTNVTRTGQSTATYNAADDTELYTICKSL